VDSNLNKKKGALSLAERAQQRVLMASGLPAASKNMLQDILSSEAPRASAAMASLPRTSARSSPVDEEARKRQEAERKAREELREQLRKEEEDLEKEEDSEDDEEGHDKKKKERKEKHLTPQKKEGHLSQEKKENQAKQTQPSTNKPQVVFILGGPGSGKSTQCESIVREYGFVHLFAEEFIANSMEEGKTASVEVTIGLLKKEIEKSLQIGKCKFLIDGFPRNHENLQAWEKELNDFADIRMVLYFECNEKNGDTTIIKKWRNKW